MDAEKVYDILLRVLGLVGVSVSGWSIATLLHGEGGMPWGFAAIGVGVYDLLAFMAGLMVYIRRAEPHRAVGAQAIMLASIGGSAYVNYMHGRQVGGDLVALIFGAAPVVFEVAFAMRHNVLSVITSILFPRAMWRRYKDGVWIKLHTGSLPTPSGSLPEVPEAVPAMVPEASALVPEAAEVLPEAVEDRVTVLPEASGPEGFRKLPEALAEVLPLTSGSVPVGMEARAEAVAQALLAAGPDEKITGAAVGALYGVSDSMGRTYIRRARLIIAAREAEGL
jgi:hypothetical protein